MKTLTKQETFVVKMVFLI